MYVLWQRVVCGSGQKDSLTNGGGGRYSQTSPSFCVTVQSGSIWFGESMSILYRYELKSQSGQSERMEMDAKAKAMASGEDVERLLRGE